MKQKITTKQLIGVRKLFKNLQDFQEKKMGTISEIVVMTHQMMPDKVLVKYEKQFSLSGTQNYEFKIASINPMGEIEFIEDKFKDAFEQAAFLSVCMPFNIEDEQEYEKID